MNHYHQNGPVAVSASGSGSDNLAGFGARRFMQDMYQQKPYASHHGHYHGSQDGAYYRDIESSVDRTYEYDARNQYGHSSATTPGPSSGYYQSPSPRQATLPLPTMSTDEPHRAGYRSPQQIYRPLERHDHQSSLNDSRPRVAAAAPSSSAPRGADTRAVWRSDSLESYTSDSTASLTYAHSGDSQYSRNGHLRPVDAPGSSRMTSMTHTKAAERCTIYEDDYEELIFDTTSATVGDTSADASFTIARATVLEPDLPKAKCADCGEKLDFEELASHSCQPATSSRPPLLSIQLPSSTSSSTLSSTLSSPPLTTPRSPFFFDRYDSLVGGSAPVSPALFQTAAQIGPSRGNGDDEETPKAHAVRPFDASAANDSAQFKPSSPSDAADSRLQPGSSSPLLPPSIQRSSSDSQADAAAARRKMIEEQRAAKKKDFMASPLPRAATTSDLSKQSAPVEDLSRSKSAKSPPGPFSTLPRVRALDSADVQHVKTESSSSASSGGTGSSGRTGSTRKPAGTLTADITPSSSYERIEDDAKRTSTKTATGSASSKQSRERGRVDLSGIEEMMKDLTDSPESLERTLTDHPTKGGVTVTRPRAATDAPKSEREQALELELQRLREKERSRHLQALRLKEKKKKERAAKRCCICDCSLSSSRTPFVERDGKLLCARDWKELYLPKCRKCNLIVEKGAVKSSDGALRGVFHRSCFSCAACEAPFTDGSFYVFNNQPYCSRHYHRLNGSLCRECEGGIEGDCRQTDTGDRFHPHCFSCQYSSSKSGGCLEPLADYYMVGGQRLCERHADKVGRRLAKAGQKQLDLRAQKRMTMLHSLR